MARGRIPGTPDEMDMAVIRVWKKNVSVLFTWLKGKIHDGSANKKYTHFGRVRQTGMARNRSERG